MTLESIGSDNWHKREALEEKAKALGYDYESLMIIDPKRFQDGQDGPCHSDEQRKLFWTDVCKSLSLSLQTIFEEARSNNNKEVTDQIKDLEQRIEKILRNKTNNNEQFSTP